MELLEAMSKIQEETLNGGELTEMPCPLCGKPRSQRSNYVRCQPCGVNWLDGEDLEKSPLLSRPPYKPSGIIRRTASSTTVEGATASPAKNSSIDKEA